MTTVKASGCITAIHFVCRYSLKTRYTVPISIFYYTHNWFIKDSNIRVISWHHPVSSQQTSRLSATKKQSDISTEEILAETKPGSDSELWKKRALKLLAQAIMWLLFYLFWMPFLQPITGALSNISKFIPKWIFVVSSLLIFMVTLALRSKRKDPRNVSFDDLVGVNTAKVELKEILSILQGKSEYKRLQAKLPDGVLLYGPPGTGKTTLVHALAREAKVSFFPVSARDIAKVSTGVGEIKSLFLEARICSPSIIFIDDAAVEEKGNCEHGSPFMELYNEMEKCNNDGSLVVVIAATDTPETLDPTLLSFGRFSKKVHVGKPDKDVKRKIVDLHLKKVLREEDKEAICNLIASQTEGLVWDDLKNIADESTRLAARRGDNHVTVGVVYQALRRVTHNCHNDKGKAMIQGHMQHNAESLAFESQN